MPINEPYNPSNDPRINPFARRGNDIIKRFVNPASSISGGGNGVTSLDDPTYLGFSLRFDILSPLFNGAANGQIEKPPSENPVFDAVLGALSGRGQAAPVNGDAADQDSSLSIPSSESAIGYLKKIGEVTRANYLKSFIQGLREINEFRPYYWQTIDGLTDAWSKTLDIDDPYVGSANSAEGITIGCLEAIDLKVSALFNLYKAAVYDAEYRRMVLPKNLMQFRIEVDVHEIRKFKSTQTWLSKLNLSDSRNDVDRFLNENTSKITFVFEDCIWVPSESGKVFENVTNAGGNTMAATSMKWQYGNLYIKSDFAGIDQELNDKTKLQNKGKLGAAIKNAAKQQAEKAGNAILNRVESRARGLVQSTVLGNVFSLRNQVLSFIRDPGALAGAIEGALFQQRSQPQRLSDNPLSSTTSNARSQLNSSNVFGPGPSGPPQLNSNNVFE